MMQAKILIIEDETTLAEVLADNLSAEGYAVRCAADGASGLKLWQQSQPNLIILDVMLPKQDGFSLCQQMRAAGDLTPVLFLSAKGQPEDRVRGLSVGGDDYLAKPFHLPEFLLRVRNMLRRQGWGPAEARYQFGGHTVDFRRWVVTLADGREEPLGERELSILKLLVSRADEVVSRDEILDAVWGDDAFPSSRTVDNFVMRLRRLFEPDPSAPIYLHTVWGVGYKFTPEGKVGAAK
jgi:two-component system alkaline phosphatase synthesis response regulator PhoP